MANNVREIAKRANVSAATVSRVMHQSENVKAETRERVEAVMKEMGLNAGELVRSARKGNNIIAVLVPDLTNSFFIELLQGIEELAEESGVKIVICHTKESDKNEVSCLRLINELHVGGIIITPVSDDDDSINNEYLNLLSNMKIPVVLLDRDVKYLNYSGIFIDNERGAFDITRLLLNNGHRRIAMIGGPMNTVTGRGRRKGYINAFKLAGIPVNEALIYEGDFSVASGIEITDRILNEHPDVTAVFSANNNMTMGCIKRLNELSYRVPDDIAVVSFDDIRIAGLGPVMNRLTVVDRPTREMGRQAMHIMNKLLEERADQQKRVILIPKLIVRGSEKLLKSNRGLKFDNTGLN